MRVYIKKLISRWISRLTRGFKRKFYPPIDEKRHYVIQLACYHSIMRPVKKPTVRSTESFEFPQSAPGTLLR